MKKLFSGLAALPLLAGVAMADQLAPLTDAQMDKVTAGLAILQFSPNNSPIFLNLGNAFPICTTPCVVINCPTCDGFRGFPTVTATVTATVSP